MRVGYLKTSGSSSQSKLNETKWKYVKTAGNKKPTYLDIVNIPPHVLMKLPTLRLLSKAELYDVIDTRYIDNLVDRSVKNPSLAVTASRSSRESTLIAPVYRSASEVNTSVEPRLPLRLRDFFRIPNRWIHRLLKKWVGKKSTKLCFFFSVIWFDRRMKWCRC